MLRSLFTSFLLAAVGVSGSLADATSKAEAEQFKAAYAAYQQHSGQGNHEEALPHARTAYEIGQRNYADDHPNRAALAYNYGLTLLEVGQHEAQARDLLQEAVKRYEKLYGKDSAELIPVLMDMGRASAEYFNAARQKRYFNRALKLAGKHYGKKSVRYGRLCTNAGISILESSRSPDARRYLEDGYRVLAADLGESHPLTGYAAFYLAKYEMAARNYVDAEPLLTTALATFESPEAPSNSMEMYTHAFLVEIYEETGQSDKATAHCQAIGRMTPVDDTQDYVPLFKRAPKYPIGALERGLEGSVIVQFTVDQEGIVRDPRVVKTEGRQGFNDAAIAAARRFRYAPRFQEGQPVETPNVLHRITFELVD